jgi:hypothetical protein
MEVVQSEAEEVFLDTAATVRGVREGARAMGRGRAPSEPPPVADADDLLDADAEDLLLPEAEEPHLGDGALPPEER